MVATLIIDRPARANAFSAQLMSELTDRFVEISRSNARVLVLTGRGKHFSAGADLNWMRASAKLSYEENIEDASKLTAMFEGLVSLKIPVVAAVKGAVYGGAVGLVACCDIVVADPNAKFCLSEVRLGLLPAVILPYLSRRMAANALRRFALTARVFTPEEARDTGLVDVIGAPGRLDDAVREELSRILTAGPEACGELKRLLARLESGDRRQAQDTAAAIARARVSREGQAGLTAFFEKKTSPWCVSLGDWRLPEDVE